MGWKEGHEVWPAVRALLKPRGPSRVGSKRKTSRGGLTGVRGGALKTFFCDMLDGWEARGRLALG